MIAQRLCTNVARVGIFALALGFADIHSTRADDAVPSIPCGDLATAEKIRNALDQPCTLEFIETPLDQVVGFIQDHHDIPVQLDTRAMDNVGVGTNVPITNQLKGISLRSGLRQLLRDLDLDFAILDEVLLITTPEVARQQTRVCVYNVGTLLGEDETSAEVAEVVSFVVNGNPVDSSGQGGGFFSVPDMVNMGQFGMGGGGGGGFAGGYGDEGVGAQKLMSGRQAPVQITPFRQLIIVRATDDGQRSVADLLAAMLAATKAG